MFVVGHVSNCDRSSSSEDRHKLVQSKAKSLVRLNKNNNSIGEQTNAMENTSNRIYE